MGLFGNKKEEDDYNEDEDEVEEYTGEYECDNCLDTDSFDIPVGTRIDEFLKGKKCESCGCLILGAPILKDKGEEE
jgi:hypothetical protein